MTVRDLLPSKRELIEAGLLAILGGLALWSFEASYGGVEFFVTGAIMLLAALAIVHMAERLDFPVVLTLGVVIVFYAVVGGAVALPGRATGGFIPSPDSTLTALRMAIVGWKELVTTAPPVGHTGDLFVIPVLVGVVTGGGALLLARRLPRFALVALVPAAVGLGLGIATGVNSPVSIVLHGGLFAAVALGWLAWSAHIRRPLLEGSTRHRSQLALAVVVLAVAAAVGTVGHDRLPAQGDQSRDIWRQTVTPPFDAHAFPSPLSGYRRYVKAPGGPEGDDPVIFTVEGLPDGVPIRLATMDSFDGLVWQVSGGDAKNPSLRDSGSFERVGARLEPDTPGELATVIVTIGKYHDVWIPDVGEVVEISFTGSAGGPSRDRELAKQFRYNRATDTAASRTSLHEGDRYEMVVRLPVGLESLAGEEISRDVARLGPAVPGGEVTTNLGTPDVLAISDDGQRLDYVRKNFVDFGTYSDGDREAGQLVAAAGHSTWRLAQFVRDYPRQPLIGNAEQYASTFALLFRDLGQVPTRVVMGFLPKEPSIDTPVEVRATNVEAWVEVPVADKGWVAIFPTPPRDHTSVQSSAPQQPEPDYRTQNPPPPPLIDPEFDQPATATGDAIPPSTTVPTDESAEDGVPVSVPGWAPSALLISSPFLAFLAFALVIVMLKRRRLSKRRSRGLPHEKVVSGWHEVTDFAVDSGRPVPSDMTRREAAGFVGTSTHELARRADAIVWSGAEPDQATVDSYWDDLVLAVRSMKSELPIRDRLKATLSIESFKAERARRREKVEA